MDVLGSIQVVDFSTEIAGPYASKLLADAGADVVKVESADGDPLRRRSSGRAYAEAGDSPLFRYLNASKRSIVGHPDDLAVLALVANADVVVESFVPRQFDPFAWCKRFPGLVILSVTPYGRRGRWENRPASEFVVQAEAGSVACRGRKDGVPFQIGGRLSEWLAGLYGAAGVLAAVLRAGRTGVGEHVDSSWLAAINFAAAAQACAKFETQGDPPAGQPFRFVEAPSIEPTKDGYVGLNTNTISQFESLAAIVERPELLEDARWRQYVYRANHVDELNEMIRPWTRAHTTSEVIELASLFRIPVAQVNNGKTVLEHEQFAARKIFGRSPDGEFLQPGVPYVLNGQRPVIRRRSPRLGEDAGTVVPRPQAPRDRSKSSEPALPMHGIRVLDATAWWAGPTAGQVLAALGAEVIHLESVQHPDPMRFMVGPAGKLDHWWERSSLFLGSNVNKLGLTLDLQDVRGREVAIDLIRQSDVMFENFSPRVFDSFGFDHSRILEINPRIVFVRMPAFGLDGPWRNNVGFAQTMEQVTGQAWLTGFVEEGPSIPRGPCDPLAGYQAVFAAMVGLARRERDGEGCFIESAMVEAVLGVTAEQVIEYTGHGRILERDGNRSPDAAPQGLYRCQGHEQWLALSILDDRQWQALKLALGSPEWAEDASLDEASGRAAAQDVIDEHLGRWAVDHEAAALVERLLAFGIPAGMMRDPRWLFDHPQFQDLRYFEIVEHPVAGAVTVVAVPFRYASVAGWVRSPAPLLGEHNERVLSGILGLGEDAIKLLSADQVIGTRPSNL